MRGCGLTDGRFGQPDVVGFRKSANIKTVQEQAYRAWMTGLLFNVVAGVYSLAQLRKRVAAVDEKEAESVVEKKKIERYVTPQDHHKMSPAFHEPSLLTLFTHSEGNAAKIQLISDLCDLAVPLSALGYVTLDDGIVGLSGTVSSLLGLWTVWKKTA